MFETISSLCGFCLFFMFMAIAGLLYQCILRFWFYFSDRNVKFVRGLPLLGSTFKSVLGIEPAAITYRRCYDHFPSEKLIGIYDFCGRPSFLIRDPDLIKQILITDSDHFANHEFFAHSLMRSKWQETRFNASPIFSGSKMRMLHSLMVKKSETFIETLKETDKIAKIFDSRDLINRYANDIIATAIFGLELNSMRDMDNEFSKASSSLIEFRYMDSLKFLANLSVPSLMTLLDVRESDEHKNLEFIRQMVKESIEAKRKHRVAKNDLIDMLIKARDGQLQSEEEVDDKVNISFAAPQQSTFDKSDEQIQNWNDDDMVTQSLIFFLSTISSISGTVCFMLHELAVNPDIQNKLFVEIDAIKNELNGSSLTYDIIPKMKYLDQVICETLRRWCPIPFLERTCDRPYVLENSNGAKVPLQIGDGIFIPTYALHMDEKYFSKPIKFDPERFNDESRAVIRAGTYLPNLGLGPRNCVGSRFALTAIKTIAFHLLSEFHIDKSYKTQDPLKLKALPLHMDAEKGFFVELRRRHPDRTPYKSQVFT